MPGHKQIASHNDFVAFQAHVEDGCTLYQAAQKVGLPLGAFKSRNADPEWFAQIKERCETVQAALVDERMAELTSDSERVYPSLEIAKAKAHNPAYRLADKVELTGDVGLTLTALAALAGEDRQAELQPTEARQLEPAKE